MRCKCIEHCSCDVVSSLTYQMDYMKGRHLFTMLAEYDMESGALTIEAGPRLKRISFDTRVPGESLVQRIMKKQVKTWFGPVEILRFS